MRKYIGCDAHARYSIFASLREDGRWDAPVRWNTSGWRLERFLKQFAGGFTSCDREFGQLVLAGTSDRRGGAGAEVSACTGSEEAHAGTATQGPEVSRQSSHRCGTALSRIELVDLE